MRNTTISTLFFILLTLGSVAQNAKGIIVETHHDLTDLMSELFPTENQTFKQTKLSKVLPYYLVEPSQDSDAKEVLATLKKSNKVNHAAYNIKTEKRLRPNDDFFSDQLAFEIIKAEEAWNISTGGLAPNGQEIVVAVIDDGFDLSHQDLVDNLWVNPGEIPNDGEDNDNNGFIDDVFGLNLATASDEHNVLNHGTGVLGIIGAKGDNNVGVTGLNWNIKLMALSTDGSVAKIIEAYDYVREQIQKFNDTNGAEGAFVVATNSSFGINNQFGSDFPLWCNMYNSMGNTGILSIAATSNDVKDIDMVGDMPTTCDSKFVIAVTNLNASVVLEGAFGAQNIDLGAPGEECYSTRVQNKYGGFSGTSAACPLVTGAIALMHSINSPLINGNLSPAELACELKSILLSTVDSNTALTGKSVSGGLLNLEATINALRACPSLENPESPLNFCEISPNPASDILTFSLASQAIGAFDASIFDELGKRLKTLELSNSIENKWIIDVSDLSQGTYFLIVENEEHSTSTKFIKY